MHGHNSYLQLFGFEEFRIWLPTLMHAIEQPYKEDHNIIVWEEWRKRDVMRNSIAK